MPAPQHRCARSFANGWAQGTHIVLLAPLTGGGQDFVREYAYGPKSKVGTFTDALGAEAKRNGWVVISMKSDWNRIFAWE